MEATPTVGPAFRPWGGRWSYGAAAVLGYGSLAGLLAVSAMLVLAAANSPGFLVPANRARLPAWIAGPFFHSGVSLSGRGFVLSLGLLVAGYGVALVCRRALAPRVVLGAIAALLALYTLAPPLLSGDIFSYVAYARMGVVHGVNPYAHGPGAILGDPVIPFTHWRDTVSVYGPVFTLLSYAFAPLGLTGALWGLKALMGLATAGLVAAVWMTARRLGRDPLAAAMLVGLNPVLLVYGVGGGHNDLLMLALSMVGVLAAVGGREAAGAVALVASVAVKASTGIVAPFQLAGARRRSRVVVGAAAATVGMLVLAVAGFGSHGLAFLVELERHQGLSSTSSWPETLSTWAGHIPQIRLIGRLVLAVAVLGLFYASWIRAIDWIAAAGWALLLLGVTSPWLLAWYTLWPLPFAAVARDRRLLAVTLFAQLLFLAHRIPGWAG